MDGGQRGRAGALYQVAGAAQVQLIRDAGGQKIGGILDADLHLLIDLPPRQGLRDLGVPDQVDQQVAVHGRPGIHADRALVRLAVIAGPLKRGPGLLQKDALLRVDHLGFFGRVAEERRVEVLDLLQEGPGLDEVRVAQQARIEIERCQVLVAEERDRLDAVAQVAPEGVEIIRAWEPASHADDRDIQGSRVVRWGWVRSCRLLLHVKRLEIGDWRSEIDRGVPISDLQSLIADGLSRRRRDTDRLLFRCSGTDCVGHLVLHQAQPRVEVAGDRHQQVQKAHDNKH